MKMELRSIEEVPERYQCVFSNYPCFNVVQSKVFPIALKTDKNIVVSAPTGSGKSVVFEFAIIKILNDLENGIFNGDFKIVYISPIKALCQEKLTDWYKKFSSYHINCVSVTGDSNEMDFSNLINYNLILSTPEKWDSLTRKWRDHEKFVKLVKLFMVDEVHLLNEENRGSTLEVIVSRMKTIESCRGTSENRIRFVAVSATVPNVLDVAEWIGTTENTETFMFSEDVRPVKLKKIVLGYPVGNNVAPFKFDLSLNYKLQSLIMQYSEGRPTLIFCSTRKSAEMAVKYLVQALQIFFNQEQREKLMNVSNLVSDVKIKEAIKNGICFHHAGMIPETRRTIENLFRQGDLPVLVTTSTLSMGVNLPAHLVIIKSTKQYDNGGFRDYTETQIQQMIGRAGRPQFDISATALILTTAEDKIKFENMVGGHQIIESNLHRHLTEHLNAEVVLRTITDLDVAMQWLSSTFLYVRARKNPKHYGLRLGLSKEQLDKKILEMCQIDLNKLTTAGMLKMDENINITATVFGQIMAKYYVSFGSMKLFTQVSGNEIILQILALVSKSSEFSELRLRTDDKKYLNFLNKNSKKETIRFPLNGKIKSVDMKVNCLIQAVLGNMDIHHHGLLTESWTIMRNGERIVNCLVEYLVSRRNNCYNALLSSIILAKCFKAKIWENSVYVSKQLNGIGSVLSNLLVNAGKTTFDKILESNPRDLEIIIKKKPPLGDIIVEDVRHIPRYTMNVQKCNNNLIKITINLLNKSVISAKSTIDLKSNMILLVGDSSNEILLYQRFQHSYLLKNDGLIKMVTIASIDKDYSITANFISDNWEKNIICSTKQKKCNKLNKIVEISDGNVAKSHSEDISKKDLAHDDNNNEETTKVQKFQRNKATEERSTLSNDDYLQHMIQPLRKQKTTKQNFCIRNNKEIAKTNKQFANDNSTVFDDDAMPKSLRKPKNVDKNYLKDEEQIKRDNKKNISTWDKENQHIFSFDDDDAMPKSLRKPKKTELEIVNNEKKHVDECEVKIAVQNNSMQHSEQGDKENGKESTNGLFFNYGSCLKKCSYNDSNFERSAENIGQEINNEKINTCQSGKFLEEMTNDEKVIGESSVINNQNDEYTADNETEMIISNDKDVRKKLSKTATYENERKQRKLTSFFMLDSKASQEKVINKLQEKSYQNGNENTQIKENGEPSRHPSRNTLKNNSDTIQNQQCSKIVSFEENIKQSESTLPKNVKQNIFNDEWALKNEQLMSTILKKYKQQNVTEESSIPYKKKRIETIIRDEESEDDDSKNELAKFKIVEKKKFSHSASSNANSDDLRPYRVMEILQPANKQKFNETMHTEMENKHLPEKSIKWRSPLVHSQTFKYSPKVSQHRNYCRDNEDSEEDSFLRNSNNASRTQNLTKTKPNPFHSDNVRERIVDFPLSDMEFSRNSDLDKFSDLCSSPLLRRFKLPMNNNNNNQMKVVKGKEINTAFDYYTQLVQTSKKNKKTDSENRFDDSNSNRHNYPDLNSKISQPTRDKNENNTKGDEFDMNISDNFLSVSQNEEMQNRSPIESEIKHDDFPNMPYCHETDPCWYKSCANCYPSKYRHYQQEQDCIRYHQPRSKHEHTLHLHPRMYCGYADYEDPFHKFTQKSYMRPPMLPENIPPYYASAPTNYQNHFEPMSFHGAVNTQEYAPVPCRSQYFDEVSQQTFPREKEIDQAHLKKKCTQEGVFNDQVSRSDETFRKKFKPKPNHNHFQMRPPPVVRNEMWSQYFPNNLDPFGCMPPPDYHNRSFMQMPDMGDCCPHNCSRNVQSRPKTFVMDKFFGSFNRGE